MDRKLIEDIEGENVQHFRSIIYLEDGRYIRILEIAYRRNSYRLFSASNELLHQSDFPNMHVEYMSSMDNIGPYVVVGLGRGGFAVINTEDGSHTAVAQHNGSFIPYVAFGCDHNTVFCRMAGNTDHVDRFEYVEGEWKRREKIYLPVKTGIDVNIMGMFHDKRQTLLIFVGIHVKGLYLSVYSVDTKTGSAPVEAFRVNYNTTYTHGKMITPSIFYCLVNYNTARLYDFSTKTLVVEKELNQYDRGITPDGRHSLKYETPDRTFTHSVSPDGKRMLLQDFYDRPVTEVILPTQELHPISTCIYGNYHWIRLMSDGTIETSETWPAPGIPRQEIRLKDVEPEAKLAVIVWGALVDVMDTFEKMKRVYLRELVRAIAKEMIPSIK